MPREAVEAAPDPHTVGYFGKVPTRGDFVQRRLPRSFVGPWDDWLQGAVAASKAQLGGAWLDCYLTSPIWRFVLSAGICGDTAVAGVLMPSVDSVGRYYPMSIVLLQPGSDTAFAIVASAGRWFAAAENAVLGCLDDGFDLAAFDDGLADLAVLADARHGSDAGVRSMPGVGHGVVGFHMDGGEIDRWFPDEYGGLLDCMVRERFTRYSLWWTAGSERVRAGLRIHDGLPAESDFAAFLGPATA